VRERMVDVHTVADRLGTLSLPEDRVKTLRERLLRVAPPQGGAG
jgi:hypothetical protein